MSAPVGNTCPDIDSVITGIKESLKCYNNSVSYIEDLLDSEISSWQLDKIENVKSELDDIESYLWGLEGTMEDLRSANRHLREWGEDKESLEEENSNLFIRIDELEYDLGVSEERCRDLENENEELQNQ